MSEGPTLRQLRYFLRAVEAGSFSAAAQAEHVSQPSMSDQIRRLERSVGAPLFTRSNRRLQLTDVGKLIIPLAEQTVRSADDLATLAREARTLSGGEVSFGMFSSAHHYLLAPLIADFKAMHPQVRIRIVGLNSSEVAQGVRDGDLEAGLVQLPVDTQGLNLSPPVLVDEVVYVSANPERTAQPVTIRELAAASLILSEAHWQTTDPLRRSLTALAADAGLTIEAEVEVEYQTAALELAAAGIGDTLASYVVTRHYAGSHKITWTSLDPLYPEEYAFVWRSGGGLSPATTRFMSLARRQLRELEGQLHGWRH